MSNYVKPVKKVSFSRSFMKDLLLKTLLKKDKWIDLYDKPIKYLLIYSRGFIVDFFEIEIRNDLFSEKDSIEILRGVAINLIDKNIYEALSIYKKDRWETYFIEKIIDTYIDLSDEKYICVRDGFISEDIEKIYRHIYRRHVVSKPLFFYIKDVVTKMIFMMRLYKEYYRHMRNVDHDIMILDKIYFSE